MKISDDLIKTRMNIEKILSDDIKNNEENSKNYKLIYLKNIPLIYPINIQWPESEKIGNIPIKILQIFSQIKRNIDLQNVFEKNNVKTAEQNLNVIQYNLCGIIFQSLNKNYLTAIQISLNKWAIYEFDNVVIQFPSYESLVKWAIFEQKLPTLLFFQYVNYSKILKIHSDTEISNDFITSIFNKLTFCPDVKPLIICPKPIEEKQDTKSLIINPKPIEQKQEIRDKKESKIESIKEMVRPIDTENSPEWKCEICQAINFLPDYKCQSIFYVFR